MNGKLDCENFELRIQRLLDDRLTLTGDPILMDHALECTDCSQLVHDYDAIDSGICMLNSEIPWPLEATQKSRPVNNYSEMIGRVSIMTAIAAALFLAIGVFSNPGNEQSNKRIVRSYNLPAPTVGAPSHPLVLSISSSKASNNPSDLRKKRRPAGFVRNLVQSRPPTTFIELAQTTPKFVNSVKLPSSGWDQLHNRLDPLNSYLQYSAEIPGIRSIQCSLEMTIELLQRSLAKPEKSHFDLGWFRENMLYAMS